MNQKRLFFSKSLGLEDYSNISFYSFSQETQHLTRDFSLLGEDEGLYFNWIDNNDFIVFDVLILEFEKILDSFNSTSKNSSSLILSWSEDKFCGPYRFGLGDYVKLPSNSLRILKTYDEKYSRVTIGDYDWLVSILKRFYNTTTAKNIFHDLGNFNISSDIGLTITENQISKELEHKLQRAFLSSLSGEEHIRFVSAHLYAIASKATFFPLPSINWEWDLNENEIERLEELFLKLYIDGPFLPHLTYATNLIQGVCIGTKVDSEIIKIWSEANRKINLGLKRILSKSSSISIIDIERLYDSIVNYLDSQIKRNRKHWKNLVHNFESISQIHFKYEIYTWTAFYAIRKQFYEGFGEDTLLLKIENKLNEIEEEFDNQLLQKQRYNELYEQIDLVKDDTLDIRMNIDDVISSIGNIKQNLVDSDPTNLELIIEKIVNEIQIKLEGKNKDIYEEEIKKWFDYWERLEEKSKSFLLNGLLIKKHSDRLGNEADYSGFVVCFSKCLEEELYAKIFLPITREVLELNPDMNSEQFDFSNLNKKKVEEYKKTLVVVKSLIQLDSNINLGAMRYLLSLLSPEKKSDRVSRIPFLNAFQMQLLKSDFHINQELIQKLKTLTDYRNMAAHREQINLKHSSEFESVYKDFIMAFFKGYQSQNTD